MDEDERLRQLIAAVHQHPDTSLEWRRAMHRLLIVIQALPEFKRYSRPEYPGYLSDALNRTWEWLSRNLKNFQPRTSSIRKDLVQWINSYLYWRIRDLRSLENSGLISLDIPIGNHQGGTTLLDQQSAMGISTPTLSGLDSYIKQLQTEKMQRIGLELELYVEQDPDGRLRQCHPRRSPHCNCQVLTQRLCLKHPPDSLTEIAREFKMNYQTVVTHWKKKGLPLLQEIAIELGHQPNQEPCTLQKNLA